MNKRTMFKLLEDAEIRVRRILPNIYYEENDELCIVHSRISQAIAELEKKE